MNKYMTPEVKVKADALVAKYEQSRAALLEILHLVMETYGHITLEAEEEVAQYMGIPAIQVREVISFYTLYYTKPRAQMRLNVCRTLACTLQGGDELIRYCENKLGIKSGHTTPDGKFGFQAVECLGACEIAPMMQVNDHHFIGNLTKEKIDAVIAGTLKQDNQL